MGFRRPTNQSKWFLLCILVLSPPSRSDYNLPTTPTNKLLPGCNNVDHSLSLAPMVTVARPGKLSGFRSVFNKRYSE